MASKSYDSKDGPKSAPPRGGKATLPRSSLQTHPELRARAGSLDPDHVEGLTEAITDGISLPRPLVYYIEGRGHFLIGGWHTVAGYDGAGVDQIPVTVKSGTWEDAILAAASQNQEHDTAGLRRTNRDKRLAVDMVLGVRPKWTDGKIAAAVGVADITVTRRRAAQFQQSGNCPESTHREGKDGKQYPVNRNLPAADCSHARSRPNSREEYVGEVVPSWRKNGAVVLPLLPALKCPGCGVTVRDANPWPEALHAAQLHLKGVELIVSRSVDAVKKPLVFRGRATTEDERAELMAWALRNQLPEFYDESAPYAEVNLGCLAGAPADLLP